MNFNKCLKTQLYKMLISPVPVICAIMIFGLCCITNVYTDADGGKGYSVLTILLLRDPTEAVEGNSVVRENIIRAAMSSWLIMFSPVVCVLPFVKSVSAENSSLKRFEMQRSGKIAFAASRLVSAGAYFSGGTLSGIRAFCDIYSNYVSVCYGYEQSFSCGSASFNEYRLLLFEPNGRCFYNRSVKCIACIYHLCFQQEQIYDDLHTVYVLLFLQHSYKQTFKRVFRQCRKDRQLIFIQRDIPSHRKRHDCVCDLSRSRIDDTCGDNWRQLLAKEV